MKREGIRDEVSPHNPWWTTAEKPPMSRDFRRSDYKHHHDLLVESRKRLLVLSGRKGIGKTNTVYRLIEDLLDQDDVEPRDVLYFPLDDPSYQSTQTDRKIIDVVEWYRQKVHSDGDRHYFLFFDDVHSIGEENWRSQVADLLDRDEDIHVVVTTVHGKFDDIENELGEEVPPPHMLPQKFFDYTTSHTQVEVDTEELKEKSHAARHSILQTIDRNEPEDIADAFENVATRLEDVDLFDYLTDYERRDLSEETPEDRAVSDQLELTIYKEIPRVRGFRNVVGAHSLCKHVAETPSGYVSYRDLESELGIESRQLKRYVDALNDFYLVNPVYPYNYDVRRNFRLYLQNPSYAYTFSRTEERVSDRKIRETVVLDHLKRLSFYFHSKEYTYTVTSGGKTGEGTDAYNFKRDIDFVFNYFPDLSKRSDELPDTLTHEISLPTGKGGGKIQASSVPVNLSRGTGGEVDRMESTIDRINEHDSDARFDFGILLTDSPSLDVEVHDNVVEIPRPLFTFVC